MESVTPPPNDYYKLLGLRGKSEFFFFFFKFISNFTISFICLSVKTESDAVGVVHDAEKLLLF